MKIKKYILPTIALIFFVITGWDLINAYFYVTNNSVFLETLLFLVSTFNLIFAYKLELKK